MRIHGSVAWITGGSSGIGAALVRELSRRGARAAVTARRAQLLEQVAASAPGEVRAVPGDVREPEALREAVAAVEAGKAEAVFPLPYRVGMKRRFVEA